MAALQARRDQEGPWLVDQVRKAARAVKVNTPLTDLMALNASFLVERAKMPSFDKAVERVNSQVSDYIKFDCVGPLPPYSFLDLRL